MEAVAPIQPFQPRRPRLLGKYPKAPCVSNHYSIHLGQTASSKVHQFPISTDPPIAKDSPQLLESILEANF